MIYACFLHIFEYSIDAVYLAYIVKMRERHTAKAEGIRAELYVCLRRTVKSCTGTNAAL